ncbi:UNVERIFIED_CONTAM: hypothetical protein GTU68_027631 [Idotea baltica]|nr:hypothetical protein [Idotea baltica]
MTRIETYIVDAFTDLPFKGNPAGVCLLNEELTFQNMLSIAKELGLSETAFVLPLPHQNHYAIRYFSPKMEIPLCGHATLAAAKIIFHKKDEVSKIHFINIQNLDLPVERSGDSILMGFPSYQMTPQEAPTTLLVALGIDEVITSAYNEQTRILMLEIKSNRQLRDLRPDFNQLLESHHSINGVVVTAESDELNYDFESRYFWPWSGTNEDPVTGGTHTFLATYWSIKLRKKKLNSFQCSERTGFMEVEIVSDRSITIKSKARIILEGHLVL